MPLVSRSTCRAAGFLTTITSRMVCAGETEGDIISPCHGDSGGPLSCPDRNGKWYLAGAVSWGNGCGGGVRYGVYADMMNLKNWVQDTMRNNRNE